jgi:hypothetical protein
VGIVQHFSDAAAIREAERAATQDGLVLLIAPLDSADSKDETLDACGFTIASQFYVGVPR